MEAHNVPKFPGNERMKQLSSIKSQKAVNQERKFSKMHKKMFKVDQKRTIEKLKQIDRERDESMNRILEQESAMQEEYLNNNEKKSKFTNANIMSTENDLKSSKMLDLPPISFVPETQLLKSGGHL